MSTSCHFHDGCTAEQRGGKLCDCKRLQLMEFAPKVKLGDRWYRKFTPPWVKGYRPVTTYYPM